MADYVELKPITIEMCFVHELQQQQKKIFSREIGSPKFFKVWVRNPPPSFALDAELLLYCVYFCRLGL